MAAQPDLSKLPPASNRPGLSYEKDIRPVLEASCLRCHGEERPRGGLRLDSLPAALKGGENGKVIIASKSTESALVIAAAQIDDETAMPPKRGRGGRGGFGPDMMLAPQMLSQGDRNGDQKLSKEEFMALGDAWFDKLDPDKSGKLTREQFSEKLGEVLPAPQGFARRGGGEGRGGAGRGGRGFSPARFVGPGLFGAADVNKDGSLTRAELKETFGKWAVDWDTDQSGSLTEEKLRAGLTAAWPRPEFGGRGGAGRAGGEGGRGGLEGGRGPGGQGGPPPPPLTAEQVGLLRAWIDQGAK